ncbi:pab-dependent poly -specific ribonuclease subunit pan3 [Phlyctema vagabunda]|uniref:PAN2-PAN3 deadenylation complex subunit PAN3 n=1 Tax=Phlyctema vagabunda TaxID=108571 RepID=A0ABR4PHC9_9HELO
MWHLNGYLSEEAAKFEQWHLQQFGSQLPSSYVQQWVDEQEQQRSTPQYIRVAPSPMQASHRYVEYNSGSLGRNGHQMTYFLPNQHEANPGPYQNLGSNCQEDGSQGQETKADVYSRNSTKKPLSVESPAFKPATLPLLGKGATISAQAASAAPFTPRNITSGTATPTSQLDGEPLTFNPAQAREFTPQSYDISQKVSTNGASSDGQMSFDPFSLSAVNSALPTPQYNPYLEENNPLANAGAGYYAGQAGYTASAQPIQYHLYAPIGPHREDILQYQRHAHDFFMPEKLREELQKKSEAALQVMPNSQLPSLDNYHTLVALDTSQHRSATVFGYPSWVYKATSHKNGKVYCLRRLEGYKLSNENSIRLVKEWRKVNNGGVVTVHDAFTTRQFGDASLMFVTDYHPLSKTLVENQQASPNRFGSRLPPPPPVPEPVLWGYIVQLTSAIKAIHDVNLAVRCIEPSKVLLTGKNRIRLNACSVLDVVQFDAQRPVADLQQEDFILFGRLILYIATSTLAQHPSTMKTLLDQMTRTYSLEICDTVGWLISTGTKSMKEFYQGIASHVVDSYDSLMHAEDTLNSELFRELENGRIARLMMKLNTINERPEFEGDPKWSEFGERYMIKLFRDYVFHQVDSQGRAVVDMGHIVTALNKLDTGSDDKIYLTSRDGQTIFLVTYKEIKKQVASAFADLAKSQSSSKARAF